MAETATRIGKVQEFKAPEGTGPFSAKIDGQWVKMWGTVKDWDTKAQAFDDSTERPNPAVKACKLGFVDDNVIVALSGYEKEDSYPNPKTGETITKIIFYATDAYEPKPDEQSISPFGILNGSKKPARASQNGSAVQGQSSSSGRDEDIIRAQWAYNAALEAHASGFRPCGAMEELESSAKDFFFAAWDLAHPHEEQPITDPV